MPKTIYSVASSFDERNRRYRKHNPRTPFDLDENLLDYLAYALNVKYAFGEFADQSVLVYCRDCLGITRFRSLQRNGRLVIAQGDFNGPKDNCPIPFKIRMTQCRSFEFVCEFCGNFSRWYANQEKSIPH